MKPTSWKARTRGGLCVAVLSVALVEAARADADDYVFSSYTVEGARFVQYAGGVAQNRDGSSAQAQSVLLGFNPSARWFTAAYAGWYRVPGDVLRFGAVSWLNHVALIEPGTSPVELGFYLKIERPQDRTQGYEITWGPTLFADLGPVQVNANAWWRQDVRTEDAGPTQLVYQWQARHRWQPHIDIGLQGFGTFGPWKDWDPVNQQEHLVGPVVFTKWTTGTERELEISVAALVGVTSGSARSALRLRALYSF
ncbi:MAG: hypothetical protein M3O01_05245 [Pseudomonadota bacterium]|nr:hypothetical protein [Pseudomonadota bacterium]